MSLFKTENLDQDVSRLPRSRSRSVLLSPATLLSVIAISDTFGGLVQDIFPATLFLRTLMVGFLVIQILGAKTDRQNPQILLLALMGYLIIRVFSNCIFLQNMNVLPLEISATLKLLYFPLLFSYLHSAILKGEIRANDIRYLLSFYGWTILVSLMLGHVTGLGGTIGGRGVDMDGGKGFMIGANEVGLMLLLTAPFVGADMMRLARSTWLGGLVQLIVYAMAGWHVFTKSSLIAVLTSAFSVYRSFVKLNRYSKWLVRILILFTGIFLSTQIVSRLDTIHAFVLDTFFAALLNEGVVAFLFRGRQDYISAIYPQLAEHDLSGLFLLFGAGEFFIRDLSIGPLALSQGEGSMFEMDFFDLIGAYGLVGMLLYSAVVIILLRNNSSNRIPFDIKIVIFSVLVHAFMAGHVLFSPQVTTLVVLILFYFRHDFGTPLRDNRIK